MSRKFELPYNFDKNLIYILHQLDPEGKTIDCIYMPPYYKDYKSVLRTAEQANYLDHIPRNEYENHIHFINSLFPGKIQILLQRQNELMQREKIQYYLNFNINKFCVGSIEQAKIIKDINSSINIVGSILMQLNSEKIKQNLLEYKKYFNGFVLPFRHCRDFDDIEKLPKDFYYLLLINAYCNVYCSGHNHWSYEYKDPNIDIKCPGRLDRTKNSISWQNATRIRPMDLGFFDKDILVYKIQDRGWPTDQIIREYILYTTNFDIYPNIIYDKEIYNTYEKRK